MNKAVLFALFVATSTPSIAQDMANPPMIHQAKHTQDKLDEILMSEAYSHQSTQTHWVQNQPKELKQEDLSWLQDLLEWLAKIGQWSQALGTLGKLLAIAFLLVLGWWIFKNRHIWVVWFAQLSLPQTMNTTQIDSGYLPQENLWQNLPPKEQLLEHLKLILQQGKWLLALAMLYQGTLREFGQSHQLPIGKHQTEDECVWLLKKAKDASPKEQAYFTELVALWRASAYGQRLPDGVALGDYSVIYRLMNAWGAIYGGRS